MNLSTSDDPWFTWFGKWYRSKDTVVPQFLPSISYMMNKKWGLQEEFSNHMLRFQQVKSPRNYETKPSLS